MNTNPAKGGLYVAMKSTLGPVLRVMYRVRVEGLEHFPQSGPVIVAANHVSFLDSFFIPLVVPRRMVYLAKAEYFESWRTRWFFSGLGMIPVKREVRRLTEIALESGLDVLAGGGVLGIYPEGTRSSDGRLYRGRTGVARLALLSGARVVPVGITGTREIFPREAKIPKPVGTVTVRCGNPLVFRSDNVDRSSLRHITDTIMDHIQRLSGQQKVDAYPS